jgi:hypothetical protein
MRRTAFAAPLLVLALTSCSGSEPLSQEWIPRLQAEMNATCSRDACSRDVKARRLALTEELQVDAADAGSRYALVANLAWMVNRALRSWDSDCYPSGSYSVGAGMSCYEALILVTNGPGLLLAELERADA